MKLEFWLSMLILVALIFTATLTFTRIRTTEQSVSTEDLNVSVTNSLYDAALKNKWNFDNEAERDSFVTDFIEELMEHKDEVYSEAGEQNFQEKIPAIALTATDGFYLCFLDTYTEVGGFTYFKKNYSLKQPYSAQIIAGGGKCILMMSYDGTVEVLTPDDMTIKGTREDVFNKMGRPIELDFLADEQEYYDYISARAVEQIVKAFENTLKEHSYGNDVNMDYSLSLPLGETSTHRAITNQTVFALYQDKIDKNGEVWTDIYSICAAELVKGAKYGIIKSGNDFVYYNTKDGLRSGTIFIGSDDACAAFGAVPESYYN